MTKREKAATIFERLMNGIDEPVKFTKAYYLQEVDNPNSNLVSLIYEKLHSLMSDQAAVAIERKYDLSANSLKLDEILCKYEDLIFND